MERHEHIWIPPPGAKKRMRGDRWVALLLAIGAAFWGSLYLALR